MAKTVMFAGLFSVVALMIITSAIPAMAEWTYGTPEIVDPKYQVEIKSTWMYGEAPTVDVVVDDSKTTWTYGSFGATENEISNLETSEKSTTWSYGTIDTSVSIENAIHKPTWSYQSTEAIPDAVEDSTSTWTYGWSYGQ